MMGALFLLIAIIGVGYTVAIKIRSYQQQIHNKNLKKLIETGKVSPDSLREELRYGISSKSYAALSQAELTMFTNQPGAMEGRLGNYDVLLVTKIQDNSFVILTNCTVKDLIATRNGVREVTRIEASNFIVKVNSEEQKVEIYSTLYDDLQTKIVQQDFCRLFFDKLIGKPAGIPI